MMKHYHRFHVREAFNRWNAARPQGWIYHGTQWDAFYDFLGHKGPDYSDWYPRHWLPPQTAAEKLEMLLGPHYFAMVRMHYLNREEPK